MINTEIRLIIFFTAKDGEALYSQQKQDRELTVAQIMEAVLLFLNLDKGKTVQVPQAFIDRFVSKNTEAKMKSFMALVSKHKGKSELEMAPYFKDDFGDTYFYFYFFVRNIKTN